MYPRYEYRNSSIHVYSSSVIHEYPARFHKHIEMMLVTAGELDVAIDGKNYTLRNGDVYLVFPNILHALSGASATAIIAIFDSELCPAYREILTRYKPEAAVVSREALPEIIFYAFERLAALYRADASNKQAALSAYVNVLLSELIGKIDLVERNSDNDLVQRLILYLQENYTREITLTDVARALNYSKYHISHVISETFQCNFRPLINSYRISMAQNLLLCTDKSISEISYECGFRNQSSFNRIFLQHGGMPPSAFRKRSGEAPEKPMVYIK